MEIIGTILFLSIPCTLLYIIIYQAVKRAILQAHRIIDEEKKHINKNV